MNYSSERPIAAVAESLGSTSSRICPRREKYAPADTKQRLAQRQDELSSFAKGLRSWKRRITFLFNIRFVPYADAKNRLENFRKPCYYNKISAPV